MPGSAPTKSGHRKRLRERFLKAGLAGFHDYEVVELLLTYAIPRRDVKPLAKLLIKRFGSLNGVFDAAPDELKSVNGVGENAAIVLSLVRQFTNAYLSEGPEEQSLVRTPEAAVELIRSAATMGHDGSLFAIYLNSKNFALGVETIADGTAFDKESSTRKALESAFAYNARSVIFVRCLKDADSPDEDEKRLALVMQDAARSVDIIVHDYIAAGNGFIFSAREKGWLRER
ncbi:MAG: RadC family protein [Deltaproteobacteria bacterium]|nr:RadC family protein [Deltaproteobacteria bacterium]